MELAHDLWRSFSNNKWHMLSILAVIRCGFQLFTPMTLSLHDWGLCIESRPPYKCWISLFLVLLNLSHFLHVTYTAKFKMFTSLLRKKPVPIHGIFFSQGNNSTSGKKLLEYVFEMICRPHAKVDQRQISAKHKQTNKQKNNPKFQWSFYHTDHADWVLFPSVYVLSSGGRRVFSFFFLDNIVAQ